MFINLKNKIIKLGFIIFCYVCMTIFSVKYGYEYGTYGNGYDSSYAPDYTSSNLFVQQGNASIISNYGLQRLNNPDKFGIIKDEIQLHANYTIPAAMIQWQVNAEHCSKLKLSIKDNLLPDIKANLIYGSWNNRTDDIAFNNITFPFIVGLENTRESSLNSGDWRLLTITFQEPINDPAILRIDCTTDATTNATASTGYPINLVNNEQWQGTASVISSAFTDIGDNIMPYGILQDITKITPTENNKFPVVFFQWEAIEQCNTIELSASTNDGTTQLLQANLGFKNWNSVDYQVNNITLPYRISRPMNDTGNLQHWNLIKLAFQPINQDINIKAKCITNNTGHTWTGNGSVISHEGNTYLNNNNNFGISKDIIKIHANTNMPPVGFLQWQIDNEICSTLTLDVSNSSIRTNETVNITFGNWSNHNNDILFEKVNLPFTISSENTEDSYTTGDWRVLAISFNNVLNSSTELSATCGNIYGTTASYSNGHDIELENGSIWSGTGSIINNHFNNISIDSLYGVNRDVINIYEGKKNTVFFQWQPSRNCPSLQITSDSQNLSVDWGIKNWNTKNYTIQSSQLPLTISNPGNEWNLIRLDFSNNIKKLTAINAVCFTPSQ